MTRTHAHLITLCALAQLQWLLVRANTKEKTVGLGYLNRLVGRVGAIPLYVCTILVILLAQLDRWYDFEHEYSCIYIDRSVEFSSLQLASAPALVLKVPDHTSLEVGENVVQRRGGVKLCVL